MYINKTKSTKTPRSLSQTLVHSTKSPHRTAGSTAPQVPLSRHTASILTRPLSLVSGLQLSHVLSLSSPGFNSHTSSHSRLGDSTLNFQSLTPTYTKNSRQRVTCIQSHKSQHHSNYATPTINNFSHSQAF